MSGKRVSGIDAGRVELATVVPAVALIRVSDEQFAEHMFAGSVFCLLRRQVEAPRRLIVQKLLVAVPEDVRRVPVRWDEVNETVELQVMPVLDQDNRSAGNSMFHLWAF